MELVDKMTVAIGIAGIVLGFIAAVVIIKESWRRFRKWRKYKR